MSLNLNASVTDSNNDPNYVKKIVMRSTISCPNYNTSFTCEHYLGYGETMAYYDYLTGDCYYTYSCDSCTYIPGGVSTLRLTTGSGWQSPEDIQMDAANVLFNYGDDSVVLRAKSSDGNFIAPSILQWQVTDLVNAVVTQNWITQDTITLGNLSSGPKFLVRTRFLGSNMVFSTKLDFAFGNTAVGAGGKICDSPTYPYRQERVASCAIGTLRNVISWKGIPAASEVSIISALGMSTSDFSIADGYHGIKLVDIQNKYNIILHPLGLKAVKLSITKTDLMAKLDNGSVIVLAIKVKTNDKNQLLNLDLANHVIAIRKVGNQMEVIDPATGVPVPSDVVAAVMNGQWIGTPQSTGWVWEILPYP